MRTRKKPEERRRELVESAHRVFREKGYAAANVTDIIRDAGVSQGTFYFYFKSKEAVFDAVAEAIVLKGYGVIEDIVTREGLTALEKIRQIIGYVMTMDVVEKWTDELAARSLRQLRDRVGSIAFDLYLPLATAIVRQGVDEGLMHVLHPEATAAYFLAASRVHLDVLKGTDTLTSEEWWESFLDLTVKITGIEEGVDLGIGSLNPTAQRGD